MDKTKANKSLLIEYKVFVVFIQFNNFTNKESLRDPRSTGAALP